MIGHKSISIADQVFENLERDILSGVYERGEILTELKLSEKLGVSRTPIREALRRLEQEHIIEMGPRGAVVVGISQEDIEIIYEMRLRLEGLAMAMAAKNADDKAIAELREVVDLQEFYTIKGNVESIKDEDSEFHKKLYRMCGCMPLADTLETLHRKIVKYRAASIAHRQRATLSLNEHKEILEAVASHDSELAERLTVRHIKNARDNIKERGEE